MKLRPRGVGAMELHIKKLAVVSASDSGARSMSDAEFEFCCLRAGSTDGTLQGIEDLIRAKNAARHQVPH